LKRADVKDISNKLKALKIVVREHKNRIKEFKSKIKDSYNLFEIKRNVEKNSETSKVFIHADINGAFNIGRKGAPSLFDKIPQSWMLIPPKRIAVT